MIANYWNNLNERERWLVGVGSACILIYLFYLLIYSPLTTAVATRGQQLNEKRETLAWIQQVRQQAKSGKKAQAITTSKLLALIGSQLNDKHFQQFPYQLQQTGPGDIQLSFDRVPYKQFLSWLWTLNSDYNISLKQFSAERSATPGVVKLVVVISAK